MPGKLTFASREEQIPLNPPDSSGDDDDVVGVGGTFNRMASYERHIQSGLNVTTRGDKLGRMSFHVKALSHEIMEGLRDFREHRPSIRSQKRARLNFWLEIFLSLTILMLVGVVVLFVYRRIYLPIHKHNMLEEAIRKHAEAARVRAAMCMGVDWKQACDRLGAAGARRRHLYTGVADRSNELEDKFLNSDDPSVTFDEDCLRVYRLQMFGNITFPYHSSQLLSLGGNQTMALFIQHGALRNAPDYFCSFKELMYKQNYRNFDDILIIAPDFNYESDSLVHPLDAFWNSSKPWGDWRVGAESDPRCCGNMGQMNQPKTISSFEVLDHMLAMLTNRDLFPRMDKISYVGHSAGGQMVQRYAVMSILAALWDLDEDVDMAFIIANPSSYTYLTPERYHYQCGHCECKTNNCICDESCSEPPYSNLAIPTKEGAALKHWPCYQWNYDRWPYGIGSFTDRNGHYIPYALRDGALGVYRARRLYQKLHVVYMVGQNDTCNDGLPTCDASCWKRNSWEQNEWKCYRNDMDTRCPAMLQGPCRRTRGHQYMKYLENLYGRPIHTLHEVPGVGHNASAMFGSEIGMHELFGQKIGPKK